MNSLRGLGVCLVLACTLFAMINIAKVGHVILAITVLSLGTASFSFLASVWRHRWDRRMAGEGRGRRAAVRTKGTP